MDNTKQKIAQSELFTAYSYLDSLFHATIEILNIGHNPKVIKLALDLVNDTKFFLTRQVLSNDFSSTLESERPVKEMRKSFFKSYQVITNLLSMDLNDQKIIETSVSFTNLIYKHAHAIHLFCLNFDGVSIQYPRTRLAIPNETKDKSIPLFKLNSDQIYEAANETKSQIFSLEQKREDKYLDLVNKGHRAIFQKKYEEALIVFNKALNYRESAEIYTLVGWTYSFLNKFDQAKSHCLKAINIDPNYGPPYNDLGTYLLKEGLNKEALKWFEMAKEAPIYQNREYPYINAGRAYLAEQNIEKALEEFSQALTLAPGHSELHETVARLKRSLLKKDYHLQAVKPPNLIEKPPLRPVT